MAVNESLHTCYEWLHDMLPSDNVTLEDINEAFMKRNIGGIIFVAVLMITGSIGNLHVLLVYSMKFKTSNYKIYILLLAFLDMTNCCISMPLVIVYLRYPFMFPSDSFCKFFRFILYYVSISSTLILVIIAVDRFRKICRPLKYQFTVFQTKALCLTALLFTLVLTWPVPFLYGNSSVYTGISGIIGTRCFTLDSLKNENYQVEYNAVLTSVFVLITLILAILYYHIVCKVREHNKIRRECQRSRTSRMNMSQKSNVLKAKTTLTLFAVTVGYLVSALPHHILAMLIFIKKDLDCVMTFDLGAVYYTFVWIFLVNNCINPIIYGFSDSRFRREVSKCYEILTEQIFKSSKEQSSVDINSRDNIVCTIDEQS